MSNAPYEPFYDEDDPPPSFPARLPGQTQRYGGPSTRLLDPEARVTLADTDMSSEEEDEVPHSLLVELNPLGPPPRHGAYREGGEGLPLHTGGRRGGGRGWNRSFLYLLTPSGMRAWWAQYHNKERAIYEWTNVDNLDVFFQRVYAYFCGKGIYCILLDRALNLLSLAFVIGFTTFLAGCVDYTHIHKKHALSDVLIPQCLSRLSPTLSLFLLASLGYLIFSMVRFVQDAGRLLEMHSFYSHLLSIPDADMQTVDWNLVVERILLLRSHTPSILNAHPTAKLDAHDITNRVMRRENYLIALFNRDLLDIRLPSLSSLLSSFLSSSSALSSSGSPSGSSGMMLTRNLEWNLKFCILNYVFDEQGQMRKAFLKDVRRAELIQGLRRRFLIMALVNAVCAPFILVYLLLFFFFRYFEEYHKTPAAMGSRRYSPYARWRFREYDELPHLFDRRLHASYARAMEYLDQFPKEKTAMAARFVAFVAGSFAAVLGLLTLYDQEILLGLEITHDRPVFFYLGLFGTVMAVARGMVPDEHVVFSPGEKLMAVVGDTHYLPAEWAGRLHTDGVRREFGGLFAYRVVLFLQEVVSVVVTPIVLWGSLPGSAGGIVDFFREFTVDVDGLGHVCSFAVFDFRREGRVEPAGGGTGMGIGAGAGVGRKHSGGKMEKSFIQFKANHPQWEPSDPESSLYLERLMGGNVGKAMPKEKGKGRASGYVPPATFPGIATGGTPARRPVSRMAEEGLADESGAGSGIGISAPGSQYEENPFAEDAEVPVDADESTEGGVTTPGNVFSLFNQFYESPSGAK